MITFSLSLCVAERLDNLLNGDLCPVGAAVAVLRVSFLPLCLAGLKWTESGLHNMLNQGTCLPECS